MSFSHPALKDMAQLGCGNQKQIVLAFQTYLELCEVQDLEEVDYQYQSDLDIIYLTSKDKERKNVYVPLFVKDPLTPAEILRLQEALTDSNKNRLYLVIRDSESNGIMYQVTQGLVSPRSPEETKEKAALDEKKSYCKAELKNMAEDLYEEAKKKLKTDTLSG